MIAASCTWSIEQAPAPHGGAPATMATRPSSPTRRDVAGSGQPDPQRGIGVFCDRARRRPTEVSAFIDQHRQRFGVEPIRRVLGVSASANYQRARVRSAREVQDERLLRRIGEAHGQLQGLRVPQHLESTRACRGACSALPGAAADARSRNPGSQSAWQAVAQHQARSERPTPARSGLSELHR